MSQIQERIREKRGHLQKAGAETLGRPHKSSSNFSNPLKFFIFLTPDVYFFLQSNNTEITFYKMVCNAFSKTEKTDG